MKNVFLFSFAILVIASGCSEMTGRRVRGSGHVINESRSVSGFDKIEVSGAIDVYVRQDSVTSVKVDADDNLLQYIEVNTSGSTLEIYPRRGVNLRPSRKVRVYVSNPDYNEFHASGASDIRSENEINSEMIRVGASGASGVWLQVNAPRVDAELSGASSININGKTRDFDAHASGASKVRCFELLSENTTVDLSGASHAEVYASVSLDGEASGASNLTYMGNAGNNVNTSGASHVRKKQ